MTHRMISAATGYTTNSSAIVHLTDGDDITLPTPTTEIRQVCVTGLVDRPLDLPSSVVDWLWQLPALEYLHLSCLAGVILNALPLGRLVHLLIDGTGYFCDDATIASLEMLATFQCEHMIGAFVDGLPRISSLCEVRLKINPFALPHVFNCQQLTTLWLYGEDGDIPDAIGNLVNLTSFSFCVLAEISVTVPDTMRALCNLRELDLTTHGELHLPQELFRQLRQLRHLHLSGRLALVPADVGSLCHLKYFGCKLVGNNTLLPKTLFRLTNLTETFFVDDQNSPPASFCALNALSIFNKCFRQPFMECQLTFLLCEARRRRQLHRWLPPELHWLVYTAAEDTVRSRWQPFPPDALTDPRFFDAMPEFYP
jgi:hypothetical protein